MSTVGAHGDATVSARKDAPGGAGVAARSSRTEDWIAVLIGFVMIAGILDAFHWKIFDVSKVVASYCWTTDAQIAALAPGWIDKLDIVTKDAQAKGQQNVAALSMELA